MRVHSLPFAGPIAPERISDVIAERLIEAIRTGTLKPGERLPTEQRLASEFGVGRTSVREGMQKLRALGLVETRKGLGAFVSAGKGADPLAELARWTAHDPASVVELLEARMAVETKAAALAAVRATDEDIARIERASAAPTGAAGDVDALVEWDAAFHAAILAAGRNRVVTRLYEALIAELTDFRRRTLALPWAADRSARDHASIAKAIARRDPTGARRAMADHMWVLYTEILEAVGSDGPSDLRPAPREALS